MLEESEEQQDIVERVAALDIGKQAWCAAPGCRILASQGAARRR